MKNGKMMKKIVCIVFGLLPVLAGHALAQEVNIAGNSTINICETQSYTISVVNDSGNPLTDIVVTGHLINLVGFSYVAGSASLNVDGGAICAANEEPAEVGTDLIWDIAGLCPTTVNDGQTLNITFSLYAGCPAVSASLNTTLDYVMGGSPYSDNTGAHSIQVLPGGVTITKTPDVLPLYVGDVGTWTLTITNTGFGTIENVEVTDLLGVGLEYVSSNPAGANTGQTTTWDSGNIAAFASMAAGQVVTIDLTARVIACENLDNYADVLWGCSPTEECFDTVDDGGTATASVRRLVRTPLLEYNPPDVAFGYCSDTHNVAFTITNIGDGDASNVWIAVDFGAITVDNVSAGAVYNDVDNRFELTDPIPAAPGPGNTYNLSFRLNYGTWCGGGFPTGDLLWRTQYQDECANDFFPPVELSEITEPADSSDLTVNKTGAPAAIQIGAQVTYNITSAYAGAINCGAGTTGDVTVVDTIPNGFTVVDTGGGVWVPGGGGTGGTVTWTYTPPASLNTNIILQAPDTADCETYCFTTFTNSVSATVTDCCGCVLNDAASQRTAIECEEGVDSEKTANPVVGVRCNDIEYTNTYDFNIAGVNLNDLDFEEHAEEQQQYVPGSLTVTLTGSGDVTGCVAVTDNTPGGRLVLDFSGCPATPLNGETLTIVYRLTIPRDDPSACSGFNFYSWSTLDMGAVGGPCLADGEIQETAYVSVVAPNMEVSITGLGQIMEQCATQTIQLTLEQTSTFADPRDVRLVLSGINYYVANPGAVTCDGASTALPVSCVPNVVAGDYVWTFDDEFDADGEFCTLNIEVTKRCAGGGDLVATAYYDDNCNDDADSDDLCADTATVTPALLLNAELMIEKTPEVIYATTNQVTWTIYVTNRGTGSAYNVWVDDVLGAGLRYNSSTVDDMTGVVITPNIDHNGGAINGASIIIDEIEPGFRRTITYVADQVSCTDLTNNATTSWGCNSVDCQAPVSDSATVEIRDPLVIATNVITTPVQPCTQPTGDISLRNAGQTTAYNFTVTETLPPGMLYRSGTTRWRINSGAWNGPNVIYDPNPAVSPMQWTTAEIPGLAVLNPRDTINIEFAMDAWCPFQGGDARITTSYENPCGDVFNTAASTFTVAVRDPDLVVTKTRVPEQPLDCDEEVTWNIQISNNSGFALPVVWVRDTLDNAFTYTSSSNAGTHSAGEITWELVNVTDGSVTNLTLVAQSDQSPCSPNTDNTVEVWWGCGSVDGSSGTEPGVDIPDLNTSCLAAWGGDSDVSAETREPDVGFVTMTVNPANINACDDNVTFTTTIENPGPTDAFNIDLVITLPAGLAYNAGTSEFCLAAAPCVPLATGDPAILGNTLTYRDIGDIWINLVDEIEAAGGNDTLVLRFGVTATCFATADMDLTIYYYDCCGLVQHSANSTPEITALNPVLEVTKTPDTAQVDCNPPSADQQSWTIRVENTGVGDAQVVRIEDTPGTWINVDTGASTAGIEDLGGGVYGWEINNLAAGTFQEFTLVGELIPAGYPNQNDCDPVLRENNVSAIWGCGMAGDAIDGLPSTTVYDCTYGTWSDADPALLQMADLVITAITPSYDCSGGTPVSSLTATVENQGADPSPNTTITVQASDGQGWTGTGTYTGSIAPGASVDVTIDTPAWSNNCAGCLPFSFNATVDTANAVCECDESNNDFGPFAFATPLPDLELVSVTPSCDGDGRTRVEIDITNNGCGPVDTDFEIYVEDDDGHDRTASFTSLGGTLPLNVGATQTVQFRRSNGITHLVTDCGGCPGSPDVDITVTLDSGAAICECDETDNEDTVPYTRPPWLQIDSHTLRITCTTAGEFVVSGDVTVINNGCSATSGTNPGNFNFQFRVWDEDVQPNCNGWNNDFERWVENFGPLVPDLLPGETRVFTITNRTVARDACNLACGMGIRVTARGSCDCAGGNTSACEVLTPVIPDLRVAAITPSAVCANDVVASNVRVTVENDGCGDLTGDFQIRLQDNEGYDRIAMYNADLGGVLPLGAGVSEIVEFSDWDPCATPPCADPNGYDFTVELDAANAVCECDEGNNSGTLDNQVFVFPDLVVTAVMPNMECDGTASAQVTVQNNGCATAAAGVPVRITGNIPAPVNGVTTVALANGASETITIALGNIECDTAYNITATADPDDIICECDGTNNDLAGNFNIACPTCTITGAPAQVCDNESATLGINVVQGLNPGPYTYFWSDNCGGSFDDNTSTTPTWTAPNLPGTAPDAVCTISVDVTDSAGCVNSCQVDVTVVNCVAIGNFVWFDDGSGGGILDNGIREPTEPAVPDGVIVELYQAGADPLITPALLSTTTAGGHYQFDNLEPGLYFVHIPLSEFDDVADPLFYYASSTVEGADDTNDQNSDENGINAPNLSATGISTNVFDLQPGLEPTLEPSGYVGNLPDDSVNMTADFGFIPLVAIGNFVWADNGNGTPGTANNGIFDAGELPLNGVRVELYRDDNGNNTPEIGTDPFVAFETTGGGGFYIFDELPAGNYFVHIPQGQFDGGPLDGYISSTDVAGLGLDDANDDDADENGRDPAGAPRDVRTDGLSSVVFALAAGDEPLAADETGEGWYSGTLADDSVNLTADFGLINLVAIGNYVWADNGNGTPGTANNGIFDAGELPLNGVRVELYRDDNGNNTPEIGTDPFVAFETTGGGGFYVFDELPAGNYFVHIPQGQFDGGPLDGYISSTDAAGLGGDDANDDDADENGRDPAGAPSDVRTAGRTGESQGKRRLRGRIFPFERCGRLYPS